MTQSQTINSGAAPAVSGAVAKRFGRWLRDYRGAAGLYDELLGRDGVVRPAWERLFTQLSKQPPNEFGERWEAARKLIHENGVTYNVYGDPEGFERPWELDPLPLVLSEKDWDYLQKALVQRATLFSKLLADLHGERELLAEGAIPAEMVFANERFLRPCVGLPAWRAQPLPFYAADVARSPDGRWWVVSDRTQAPSGMGYALENRIVLGRMLPDVARECQLLRVAGFFGELRAALAAAAPRPTTQPHVVLLTPGPRSEAFFEHAFLARYLGITLAEGEDLTVRDDRVFLKTLDGLRQVDVIWRRVDEGFADPLELRTESRLGVSGLLQAMRAGNVAVLNPPGSGLVEAPALMAFLPGLSRRLLGEPLQIPSVATWWCGEDEPRQTALAKLDQLVVKHAFHKGAPVLFGRGIEAESREALAAAIVADPGAYVAQEEIPYSTAPIWGDRGFEPRQVVLRVFLMASGDSYVAMPGGLTRVAAGARDRPGISMQQGSGSKDTWVLSDRPIELHHSVLQQQFPIVIRRSVGQFSSRVADNLYWIGRVAERSEFTTRLLRGVVARVGAEAGFSALDEVAPIWDYLVANELLEARPRGAEPAAQGFEPLEAALKEAILGTARPASLRQLNAKLQHLAQVSRDSLSMDTWRIVARLGELLKDHRTPARLSDCMPLLDLLVNLHAALSGLAQENTTRSVAWAFLDLGRRLERATYTAGLGLELLRASERDRRASLEAMLEVFDSAITYRQRYFSEPRLLPVLDSLLLDPANPRSLVFQIERLDAHLAALPNEARQPFSTPGRAVTTRALSALRTADLSARDSEQMRARAEDLEGCLQRLTDDLSVVTDDLTQQYFALLLPEQLAAEAVAETQMAQLLR